MVGRPARRDALELLVAAGPAEPRHEAGLLEGCPHPLRIVPNRPAEGLEDLAGRHPYATPDVHVAGREVEVPAGAADLGTLGRHRRGPLTEPWEAGTEVGLVGRFVPAEAGVPVDAEGRSPRVGEHRDPALGEAPGQRRCERLDGLLQQPIVVALARREPGPIVVLGKLDEELDGIRREAGERWLGGHRTLRDVPAAVRPGQPCPISSGSWYQATRSPTRERSFHLVDFGAASMAARSSSI